MKVRLKELGTIFTGNTPSKKVDEYWSNRDIKFIKPDVIKDELCVISSANEYISASAKNVSRIVPANSILVTCIGKIGRVGITEEEVSFNQQINAIVPNEAIIPKYLAYAIYANRKQLKAIANAPVVPIINKTQFSDFKISICESVEKQNKIVRTLDVISGIITHDKKKIEALDELIKARFVEMFENDNMNEKTIEDVASFCSRGKSPKYVTESKLKVINQACIYWDRFKFENVKYNEEDYDGDRIISNNDLLICSTGTGTLGRCNIFRAPDDSRYMADSHVTIIRLNGHILPEVFKAWFERPRTQEKLYSDCVSGSTNQIELSKEKLKNMNILVPPINLQKQFASFAKQVDKSKFAVQKSLEKTQLLFDSLMQEYFG